MEKEDKNIFADIIEGITKGALQEKDEFNILQLFEEADINLRDGEDLDHKLFYNVSKAFQNDTYNNILQSGMDEGIARECAYRVSVLMLEYSKIESLFNKHFNETEGHVCCTDKSRTVVTVITDYYKSGKVKVQDWSPKGLSKLEYTFHIPNDTSFERCIEMFENYYKNKYSLDLLSDCRQLTCKQ